MTWEKILQLAKVLGPYIIELLMVIFKGPHKHAVENLKAKGVIKDSK